MTAQDQYRILYLNTETIKISDRICRVKDTFNDDEVISWSHKKQVMKVLNTSTQRQHILAARDFNEDSSNTLSSYFHQTQRLSTREGTLMMLPQLREYLSNTFYLIDEIQVKTTLPIDESHFFYADYIYKGELIHKKLPVIQQGFKIDFSLYTIDGKEIEAFETPISIYYMDANNGEAAVVTTEMYLIPVTSL